MPRHSTRGNRDMLEVPKVQRRLAWRTRLTTVTQGRRTSVNPTDPHSKRRCCGLMEATSSRTLAKIFFSTQWEPRVSWESGSPSQTKPWSVWVVTTMRIRAWSGVDKPW